MRYTTRLSILVLCAAGLAVSGCDQTDLDPFDNDGRFYTVWGFLDALASEHVVRVVPVTRFPEEILGPDEAQASIDAEVWSVDTQTGARTRWTHELAELDDGTYGHVFRARFIVRPGRTYRLEVIRSDGRMAVAETTVPRIVQTRIMDVGPVQYSADSTEIWQDIHIPGVASPWDITAIYVAGVTTNFRRQVPYGRVGERTSDGGWRTRLHIARDQPIIHDYLRSLPNENGATLAAVGLQIRLLDANWDPPEGIFDPEVLAQPGVLSNVTGGHGFFGSIGFHAEEWIPDVPQRLLGYPLSVDRPPPN